jgi:hypothetical protein
MNRRGFLSTLAATPIAMASVGALRAHAQATAGTSLT